MSNDSQKWADLSPLGLTKPSLSRFSDVVVDAMAESKLVAGSRINIQQLAKQVGCSRTTALKAVEQVVSSRLAERVHGGIQLLDVAGADSGTLTSLSGLCKHAGLRKLVDIIDVGRLRSTVSPARSHRLRSGEFGLLEQTSDVSNYETFWVLRRLRLLPLAEDGRPPKYAPMAYEIAYVRDRQVPGFGDRLLDKLIPYQDGESAPLPKLLRTEFSLHEFLHGLDLPLSRSLYTIDVVHGRDGFRRADDEFMDAAHAKMAEDAKEETVPPIDLGDMAFRAVANTYLQGQEQPGIVFIEWLPTQKWSLTTRSFGLAPRR
jgi:hypothetical protein